MAATFSSAPAAVAFDKSASQALGALSTGMGYEPNVALTTTVATQYIGGAVETIGYGSGADVPPAATLTKAKA
jgi:hypothetical protein